MRSVIGAMLMDKTTGALVGFAIGDALGWPAAGIRGDQFLQIHERPITEFTTNARHPFFHHLAAGNYTDNTRLMMIVAESIAQLSQYVPSDIIERLKQWAERCREEVSYARMPGLTTLRGALRLLHGIPPKKSGARKTDSCACSYRVIPLGLSFDNPERIVKFAEMESSWTHNSPVSKMGAAFVALYILFLRNESDPREALKEAMAWVAHRKREDGEVVEILKNRLMIALESNDTLENQRRQFGTGSPIWQTLPLAVSCFLRSPKDFEQTVLTAANSYRNDTPEERDFLKLYSWAEQVRFCKGGNTDGIAALAGAFSGAYNGLHAIPEKFRKVENYERLVKLECVLINLHEMMDALGYRRETISRARTGLVERSRL